MPPHLVAFDVETQLSAAEVGGWNYADRMRVAIAVAYDSKDTALKIYEEDRVQALVDLMAKADLVIGFNSLKFDYLCLQPYVPCFDMWSLPTMDMLAEFRSRGIRAGGLDKLCNANLGTGKSADGLQSLQWWKEGRLDLITNYCLNDVWLTWQLWRRGATTGQIIVPGRTDGRITANVTWRNCKPMPKWFCEEYRPSRFAPTRAAAAETGTGGDLSVCDGPLPEADAAAQAAGVSSLRADAADP